MGALNHLSATEAAGRIAEGALTSEALVDACLARIEAREPQIQAWQHLDPDAARAEARARDVGPARGPLHGVPVAVKDIIDTADMPTGYGSTLYEGYRPGWDAACVARIRAAGAVVLGKTVSSEFAGFHPGRTRNPADPRRTTGISSMGSAAAVADFMAPLAFGSQTGGSIIKPASFCGVIGYKPTFDSFNLRGVHPLAPATDTLGHFARTLDDIALFAAVLAGVESFGAASAAGPPRIGYCPTGAWDSAAGDVRAALEGARAKCEAAGASVREIVLGPEFDPINETAITVIAYETAHTLAHEYRTRRDELGAGTIEVIERGRATSRDDYRAALARAGRCRAEIAGTFEGVDVLMTPAAEHEATPLGEPMGDSQFIRLWTLLHVPCLSLPVATGDHGLPIGIQVVGAWGEDQALLRAARWIEAALRE